MDFQLKSYVSASQYKAFLRCPRHWFMSQVEPVKRTQALQDGSDLHSVVEKVLAGEQPSGKWSQLVQAAKDLYFPSVFNLIGVEMKVEGVVRTDEGACSYLGYVDFMHYDQGRVVVGDHKTVSAWTWALNEEQLKADFQVNLYAYHVFNVMFPTLDWCWVEHIQYYKKYNDEYLTSSSRLKAVEGVRRVRVQVTREEAAAVVAPLVTVYMNMKRQVLAAAGDWRKMPKNLNGCKQFGGCAYSTHCAWEDVE